MKNVKLTLVKHIYNNYEVYNMYNILFTIWVLMSDNSY